MVAGQHACCRVVQHQARVSSDALWITDAALANAFQRFCLGSTSFTRHGSSVPGPLENRRRLGKRRMAHIAETIQPPIGDFPAFWSFQQPVDKQQWQWKPPSIEQLSKRSPTVSEGPKLQLPAWLTDHEPLPLEHAESQLEMGNPNPTKQSSFAEDLLKFQESVQMASTTDDISRVCDAFNESVKVNLTLGLVPMDQLAESIERVSIEIRLQSLGQAFEEARCVSFYQAILDGIEECKVLEFSDFSPTVVQLLLRHLREFPSLTSTTLLTDILNCASHAQLLDSTHMICAIGTEFATYDVDTYTSFEQAIFPNINSSNAISEREIRSRQFVRIKDFVQALCNALTKIGCTREFEKVIHSSTDILIGKTFRSGPAKRLGRIRFQWLAMVAGLRGSNEILLVDLLSRTQSLTSGQSLWPIPLWQVLEVLLEHFVSRDSASVEKRVPEDVKVAYTDALQTLGPKGSVVHFVRALKVHSQCWHFATRSLFRFLRKIGRPRASYFCLIELQGNGIVLPSKLLTREIIQLSHIDPTYALDLFKKYQRFRPHGLPLRIDACPELAMAMINELSINPREIWKLLHVPMSKPRPSLMPLDGLRAAFIRRLAMEISQASHLSSRVRLRNIVQCVRYLRSHDADLSVALTRALTEAGITAGVIEGRWIGDDKLEWILERVALVEGVDIAKTIRIAVTSVRDDERQRHLREINLFGVGPIE